MRLFIRKPFTEHWTIGCDLRNGALLQFTKTERGLRGHRIVNLLAFSYRRGAKDISNRETRTTISIGWKQGWYVPEMRHGSRGLC